MLLLLLIKWQIRTLYDLVTWGQYYMAFFFVTVAPDNVTMKWHCHVLSICYIKFLFVTVAPESDKEESFMTLSHVINTTWHFLCHYCSRKREETRKLPYIVTCNQCYINFSLSLLLLTTSQWSDIVTCNVCYIKYFFVTLAPKSDKQESCMTMSSAVNITWHFSLSLLLQKKLQTRKTMSYLVPLLYSVFLCHFCYRQSDKEESHM